jgi:hypothetical protein
MSDDKAHAAVADQEVRLGKKEVKASPKNLQLARYLVEKDLPAAIPSRARNSRAVKKAGVGYPMFRNDALGDCTCASFGHAVMTWSANAGHLDTPTDDEVVSLYNLVNHGVDEGAYMLDVLNTMRATGLGDNRIEAFVQVDHRDRRQVELGIWLFGGVYTGIALPVSAQTQKARWSVAKGPEAEPGSWGGHAVFVPDFTKMRGPDCVTWSRKMPMTWGFWRKYVDECYAVLSRDWLDAHGDSPQGFNLAKLQQDLTQL